MRVSYLSVGRWGGGSAVSPPRKERALRPSSQPTWSRQGRQGRDLRSPLPLPFPRFPHHPCCLLPTPSPCQLQGLGLGAWTLRPSGSVPATLAPSSSGCLQLQGPGDCPTRSGPRAWPGGGGALLSSSWDQGAPSTLDPCPSPPIQLLVALGGGSQRLGSRNLPRPLPVPQSPCRFWVGGGLGTLTPEGGQEGRDKARLGAQPQGTPGTWDW